MMKMGGEDGSLDEIQEHDVPPAPLDASEDEPPATIDGNCWQDVLINEEAENHKANRKLRDTYASKAYELACGCIGFWIIAIGVNGACYLATNKRMLSDQALIAITTGVTINVLAAFLGVIKGLFPSEHHPHPPPRGKAKKQGKSKKRK